MSDPVEGNDSADWQSPAPARKPAFAVAGERLAGRISCCIDGRMSFARLCGSLADMQVRADWPDKGSRGHAGMNPLSVDDNTRAMQNCRPSWNVALSGFAVRHWVEIDTWHQDVQADEALMAPLGGNVFDDCGRKERFGRCFMFMDEFEPRVMYRARTCPADFSGH